MMEPVAAKAPELPWQEQEAAELRAELHLMKTAGIIEVAVRNPSVAEYMAHWEGRALAAEALLKEARDKALEEAEAIAFTWASRTATEADHLRKLRDYARAKQLVSEAEGAQRIAAAIRALKEKP